MFNNYKEISLSDLINVDFLQKLQDNFAKTMGVASLTVDDKGPITKPSNFTNFCTNFIRASELGSKKCNECDIQGGKLAIEKGEPVIYTCHTGLTHFVVPIIVAGKHLASILGGQISLETPDEKHFKTIAKELGITDDDKYLKALGEIQVVSEEKIKTAAKLLFLVANSISEIAHKNYELFKKNQKEKISKNIIEKIRGTLDPEEIKNYFVNITQKYFDADRCIFTDYNASTGKFIPFNREKLKSQDMKSLLNVDLEEVFPEFCTKLKKGRNIIIKDLEKTLSRKRLLGYKAIKTLRESEAKSDYGLIVQYRDQIIGILIIHYIKEKRVLTHDEFDFLKYLREQAGIALYQASLYWTTKKQAEKEQILRTITNKIRSSLDLRTIKNEIVNQLGKFLGADGVRIADYDYSIGDYIVSEESEYRASDKVKSLVGIKFKEIPDFTRFIRDVHLNGKDIVFDNLEIYLDEKNIRGTGVDSFYREFGFIASAAINIYYGDTYIGDFVITFDKPKEFSDEELSFLKTLADQAGTAFYQAKLYEKERVTAEREIILRKITNKIRSSLDLEEIKHEIVNEIGRFLNADRVVVAYYDYKIDNYVITQEAEYKSSDNVRSFVGVDFTGMPGFSEYIRNTHFQGEDIIFDDLEKYLDEHNYRNTGLENFYRDFEFISSAAINIYYETTFLGNLVITFDRPKKFYDEEINFVKTLADQIGVAFHQAELYLITKQQAEKEFLLRNVSEAIRGTLDIKQTKKSIVDIMGKTLNADRCFISEYNKESNKFLVVEDEYVSSNDVTCYKGFDSNIEAPNFVELYKQDKAVLINNKEIFVDDSNKNFEIEKNAIEKFSLISAFIIPLSYQNDLLGALSIHYTKEHFINEEEITLIKTIANQVSIALYQAKLYNTTQELAKREMLLRNITETIRQSLNLDETKKRIINVIGETLKADRCFILEYNKSNDKFLIVNEEYLSSDNILAYKGVDLNKHIPNLITEFKQGKRIIINGNSSNINGEKVDFQREEFEDVKRAIEKYKVNSALIFPLFYSDEFLGDLVLHYVEVQHEIGKDDVEFLNLISSQIAMALYQSKLYEKVQLQAERERISRNIIEILRSTLDKDMIEHLFVRNIGKYFNANRVFFSEFNKKENKYLPINEKSEYLSSPSEKSLACLDLFDASFGNHFQILLNKRELLIPNWEGYIENNTKTPELIDLYKEASVKSSYSFPVLYEDRIMGYFCIEFTNKINELMDEDINRLRSICTQAGIAMYHAELYIEAQKALQDKGALIVKVQSGIKEPVENIMESSKILSEKQLERDKQKEYLNNIINSCNKLLELTKDISDIKND